MRYFPKILDFHGVLPFTFLGQKKLIKDFKCTGLYKQLAVYTCTV